MDNRYYYVICIHDKIQIKTWIPLKGGVFKNKEGLRGSFFFPFNQQIQSTKQQVATGNRDWAISDCQQVLGYQFSERWVNNFLVL